MKRTLRLLAAPAAAMLLLASCGTSDEPAPAEDTAAQEATQADADAPEDEQVDDSDAWPIVEDEDGNVVEHPEDEPMDDGGDDEEYDAGVVEAGDSGTFSTIGMDLPKGEGEIEVRVGDFECGVTSIPDAVDNPVYMESGGEEGEPNIAAEPEDGKEFCVFDMEYKNVGSTPYQVDEPGAVLLESGDVHEQSTEDQDIAWTIQNYVIDLNPGDTGEYKHVVSIPAGETPLALFYPSETAVMTSTMVLFLQ
ncbi:MAG: hypothetical protein ACTH6A_06485 [Brachybacterium tyrofermentans]|uniref:hypothetical protein n=1 Tax=Brachybacterium tyrofermentans TaxID=47848 RepID=UPI003F905B3D